MHFADGKIPEGYIKYTSRKVTVIVIGILLLLILLVVSIAVGAVKIPVESVISTLCGATDPLYDRIIWNIRLPQVLAAVVAGAGLAISGLAMQSVLRNPLASPQTLGIAHSAAFGAAFSVIVLGTGTMRSSGADAIVLDNPYITTMFAFLFCLVATGIIIGISRIRASSPEVMVLAGVAISSLTFAGTMFLQYFADDVQLAAVVFWTFGDVGRAGWNELVIMAVVVVLALLYFFLKRWDYNAIDAGDETAKGLGVNVGRERVVGMVVASFVTSVVIAFLGVIGFVGLVCPHMVRPIIGDDHRYLLPGTCVCGALLLLASDTAARLILAPHILPVAILTAFMGAPVFLYLIIRGRS